MLERTIEKLQLDGGCTVFDFTNTVNSRTTSPAFEYLKTYNDLLDWSQKVKLLPSRRIDVLREASSADSRGSEIALAKAKQARELLYRFFSTIATGSTPSKTDSSEFNMTLSECLSKLQLRIVNGTATADFAGDTPSLDEPLRVIMKSAYDILTSEDFTRLKECPNCGWLFIDRTKNGKRKWCDMQVCGSRDKAMRYYHRKKSVDS